MAGRPFTLEEERYLTSQLSNGDDRVATKALQWFCEKLRAGYTLVDASRVRASVQLCIYRPSNGAKRWAINALSFIGLSGDLGPILSLIPLAEDDPDLGVSIVANIFSQRTDEVAQSLLAKHNVELAGVHLIAASQFSASQKKVLIDTKIPLDSATPDELRAAIILAGTRKAPENLFSIRHNNSIALGELNSHDVASVSKYSIWALAELRLGFTSLRLPIGSFQSQPSEVRKWILRLLFSDPAALARNIDFIKQAQTDSSDEVRQEAAMELRETFVEDAVKPICQWFLIEGDGETRLALLEHMEAQAERSETYKNMVVEFYQQATPKSDIRNRIEAAAATTSIYRELRKISILAESAGLFPNEDRSIFGGGSMTNISQTFNNSQIGAVAGSGDISADAISAVSGMQSSAHKEILLEVLALVSQINDSGLKSQGQSAVADAAKHPKKPVWERLVSFLNALKIGASATAGSIEGVDKLIDSIGQLQLPG